MSEARRKRLERTNAPCICGSDKVGGDCCFNGTWWHKPTSNLGLKAIDPAETVERCYMRELASCSGGISGEHLISEAIIRLLADEGHFTVSGLPWIPQGEFRAIGPKSLTANCLCSRHNSLLSALDDAARRFFTVLMSCLEREAENSRFVVSGHDIERWLLKTLKAMAESGNLTTDGTKLSGAFLNDLRVLDMLDVTTSWPSGAGLYCIMKPGDLTQNHRRFQLSPLTNANGELEGMWTDIIGISFVLFFKPLREARVKQWANAVYRPAEIIISYPGSVNHIMLSWEDGANHSQGLTLQLVAPAVTPR
jgi:hypothetical protein